MLLCSRVVASLNERIIRRSNAGALEREILYEKNIMKVLTISLVILFISSLAHSQSSIVYDAGTNIDVGIGADICATNIFINGTYSGGGTKCDVPLPVEFSSFTFSISYKGRDVTLIWKTSNEVNNSGFDVERKIFGKNEWNKISFVAGKGNSKTIVQYSYEDKKLNSGKYNYRLKQIDYNGNFEYHYLIGEVDIATPKKFNVSQNYPNPFNPVTKIDFELPVDCKVTIKVYDITGREIAVLLNNELKSANYYTVDIDGSRFTSGVYFYRLTAGNFIDTKKMILIK